MRAVGILAQDLEESLHRALHGIPKRRNFPFFAALLQGFPIGSGSGCECKSSEELDGAKGVTNYLDLGVPEKRGTDVGVREPNLCISVMDVRKQQFVITSAVRLAVHLVAANFHILYSDSCSRQKLPAWGVWMGNWADFVFFINNERESFVCQKGYLSNETWRSTKAYENETMVFPMKPL